MPTAWTREEVEATVADYFDMWTAEFSGRDYSKAEHLRRLQPLLNDRSTGSVEFKRGNISGVLNGVGKSGPVPSRFFSQGATAGSR